MLPRPEDGRAVVSSSRFLVQPLIWIGRASDAARTRSFFPSDRLIPAENYAAFSSDVQWGHRVAGIGIELTQYGHSLG